MTLVIRDVPVELMEKVQQRASAQSPRVSRNDWILYVCEQSVADYKTPREQIASSDRQEVAV